MYVPASCLLNLVIFNTEASDTILSIPELVESCAIGSPSFVQVYAIFDGLPSAFKEIIRGSFSIPVMNSSFVLSKTGLSKEEHEQVNFHFLCSNWGKLT